MKTLNFKLRPLDDGGHECIVTIGDVHIGANSEDAPSALHAAAGLAAKLAAEMEKHPELQALMPPQATAALQAMQVAAYVAKNKKLPPGVKNLSDGAVKAVKSILKGFL